MAAPQIDSTNTLLNALEVSGTGGLATAAGQVVGGASILTTYDASDTSGAGYGWLPTNVGVRSNGSSTADNQLHGTMLASGQEFTAVDGSSAAGRGKRLFYTHIYSSQGSALNNWNNVGSSGYGGQLFLFSNRDPDLTAATDRTANCRGWCVGGRDTIPTLFAPTPTSFMAVDAEHTASEVETGAGTELTHITVASSPDRFDPTSIVSAAWGWKLTGGGFIGTVSRFGYYDAYTAYEGDIESGPGTFQQFYDTTQAEQHYGVAKGDTAQFRFRLAIEFGTAARTGFPGGETGPTRFIDQNISVEFSESMQSLTTPLVRVFHGPFNKIGMESYLRSGDLVRMTNVQFTGATPWHFRFDSDVGATVEFDNCIIQNAGGTDDDCEINGDVVIDGGLIDQCGKFSVNDGTLQSLAVSNPASDAGVDIVEASTLEDVRFTTTDPNKYAIEIPDPASGTDNYTLDNVLLDGFDFDVRVLGTTGTVNIAITNGGDTPTISKGTESTDTPVLLGAGWVDGTTYTAVAGGGDDKRAIIVVVSNNGSKLPTGVTFGGTAMTLIASNLQDAIGLSMWIILETGNSSVFTGSQTIAATYTGGDPASITYQSATYDHINQTNQVVNGEPGFLQDQDSNSEGGAGGTVSNLDTWQSGRSNSPSFSISSGTDRVLVVIINNEHNTGTPGATAITWGGQSLTLQVTGGTTASPGNRSQIWTLDETGISNGVGTTLSITMPGGADTADYGAATFSNVDQTTPVRDTGNDTGQDPSTGANLDVNDGDMLVAGFASTGGGAGDLSSWDNLMASPDASFADNTGDDPSHGAYKSYSGSDITNGTISATGGDATRTGLSAIVLAGGAGDAGNLNTTLNDVEDEGLVVSAAHTESTTPFGITFTGDVTERDQVDVANRRVAVADYVETAGPATVTANMTDTSSTTGADAQMLTAKIRPSKATTGGPTVNVTNNVTVTIRVIDTDGNAIEGARVRLGTTTGGTDVFDNVTTPANGVVSTTFAFTSDQAVEGAVRKGTTSPVYKAAGILATITSAGLDQTITLVLDE